MSINRPENLKTGQILKRREEWKESNGIHMKIQRPMPRQTDTMNVPQLVSLIKAKG
jgi:hypothetical protein